MDNLTQFTKIEQTAGRRNTVLRVITYVLLTLWALVVLFPFYWMLLTSVKVTALTTQNTFPAFLP